MDATEILHRLESLLARATAPPLDRDDFLSVTDLIKHSGMSRRTLHKYLHDPIKPIPHRMIGGKIYVLVSEFRTWHDQHKVESEIVDVRAIVATVNRRG